MIKFTVVPPNPAPVQLTAKAPTNNLGTHLLAFLNANNKKGFLPDNEFNEQTDVEQSGIINPFAKHFLGPIAVAEVALQSPKQNTVAAASPKKAPAVIVNPFAITKKGCKPAS